jgi:hypothetical protein
MQHGYGVAMYVGALSNMTFGWSEGRHDHSNGNQWHIAHEETENNVCLPFAFLFKFSTP